MSAALATHPDEADLLRTISVTPSLRAEHAGSRAQSLTDTLERARGGGHAVGESAAWRGALAKATLVASTNTTVFLQGESGWARRCWAASSIGPRAGGGSRLARSTKAPPFQISCSNLKCSARERGAFYRRVSSEGRARIGAGVLWQAASLDSRRNEPAGPGQAAAARQAILQESASLTPGGTRVGVNVRCGLPRAIATLAASGGGKYVSRRSGRRSIGSRRSSTFCFRALRERAAATSCSSPRRFSASRRTWAQPRAAVPDAGGHRPSAWGIKLAW